MHKHMGQFLQERVQQIGDLSDADEEGDHTAAGNFILQL